MGLLDKDQLMRQVRQLVQALLLVRAQRLFDGEEAARESLAELFSAWVGMPASLAYAMPPESLVDALCPHDEVDPDGAPCTLSRRSSSSTRRKPTPPRRSGPTTMGRARSSAPRRGEAGAVDPKFGGV